MLVIKQLKPKAEDASDRQTPQQTKIHTYNNTPLIQKVKMNLDLSMDEGKEVSTPGVARRSHFKNVSQTRDQTGDQEN